LSRRLRRRKDALAGRVQLVVLAVPSAAPNYPPMPTIAETFPGVEYIGWIALAAPAGTPDAVVTQLNLDLGMILARPQIVAKLDFSTYAPEPHWRAALVCERNTSCGGS
jgi:tripartite-type tricarboxylate transporter receptor subunit TctC